MKFYKSEDVLLSNELDRLPLHRTLKIEKIIHKLSIKVNGFGGQAKRKHRIKRDLSSVFPAYAGVIPQKKRTAQPTLVFPAYAGVILYRRE